MTSSWYLLLDRLWCDDDPDDLDDEDDDDWGDDSDKDDEDEDGEEDEDEPETWQVSSRPCCPNCKSSLDFGH
jgi:hypothetical protein